MISHFHQLSAALLPRGLPPSHHRHRRWGWQEKDLMHNCSSLKTHVFCINVWGISRQVRYVATLFPTESWSTTVLPRQESMDTSVKHGPRCSLLWQYHANFRFKRFNANPLPSHVSNISQLGLETPPNSNSNNSTLRIAWANLGLQQFRPDGPPHTQGTWGSCSWQNVDGNHRENAGWLCYIMLQYVTICYNVY